MRLHLLGVGILALIVACGHLDRPSSARAMTQVPAGALPYRDVLAFDTGLRRLYVAAESGVISAFWEHGRSHVKVGQGFEAQGAHTIAVDSRTHRVYLPLEGTHNHPVLRIMAPQSAR